MIAPVVSVVVPARNAAGTLAEQMRALARQDYDQPWELVVVDNGSHDDTRAVAIAQPTHGRCSVLVVDEPRPGLNIARNAGVRASSAPLIAICDADDLVSSGWLTAMAAGLARWDLAGGAFEFALLNSPSARAMRGVRPGQERVTTIGTGLGFLPQVIGANIAFRREVWQAVDGFDESFAEGGDDVDFGWRCQHLGFSLGYVPEAVVHYRFRASKEALLRQYVRDGTGSAHLYAIHRSAGMPRRQARDALRTWFWLARHAPWVLAGTAEKQGQVLRVLGKNWGRVRGSVRHGVVFP